MTRIDGVHGPKPEIKFIDDWSVLERALAELRRVRDTPPIAQLKMPDSLNLVFPLLVSPEAVDSLLHYVPALRDAYAELWELTSGLMRAVEAQRASQNDFYVPDAQELVSGLANPDRSKR